jgi:hypothetical protein
MGSRAAEGAVEGESQEQPQIEQLISRNYGVRAHPVKELIMDPSEEVTSGNVVGMAAQLRNLRHENDLLKREMALLLQEHALATQTSSQERVRLLDEVNRLQGAIIEAKARANVEPSVATLAGFMALATDENGAVKSECIPLLVELLDSPAPPIQLWALESLAQLLESEPYRKPAFKAGCLPPLISLLNSTYRDTRYLVLSAFCELCKTEQAPSQQVCRSGAIRIVVDLLPSPLIGVQAKAAAVVYEIMGWKFGMTLLGGAGVLPAIGYFVASSPPINAQHLRRMKDQLDLVYTA